MGYRSQNNWDDSERKRIDAIRATLPWWQRWNWFGIVLLAVLIGGWIYAGTK